MMAPRVQNVRKPSTPHVVIGIIFLLFLFRVYQSSSRQPHSQLPGTYQYFREEGFSSNSRRIGSGNKYDARYAPKSSQSIEDTQESLQGLLETYIDFMHSASLETWIAHGALIGYSWNQQLLPWDTDLDAQVSIDTMRIMAQAFNMTEHNYTTTDVGRGYLLDVNPHFSILSTLDVANVISARWIDTTSGKYVDITAVFQDPEDDTKLLCKDHHRYQKDAFFPLQDGLLAGIRVRLPGRYRDIVKEEYGSSALRKTNFHW